MDRLSGSRIELLLMLPIRNAIYCNGHLTGYYRVQDVSITYLHSNEAIIDHNILRQKVGADGGLVLVAEFFVDIRIAVLRNNMMASKVIRKYVSN